MAKQPLDRLRSRKKQVWKRIPIPLDSDIVERRESILSEINRIEIQGRIGQRRGGVLPEDDRLRLEQLQEELDEVTAELSENVAWFHVRSLAPRVWEELVSRHPPTKDQRDDARKSGIGVLLYNVDTFFDELVPMCVSWVDTDEEGNEALVPLTETFVKEMQEGDQWSTGEWNQLCEVASTINSVIRRIDDLGNVSRRTR